MRPALRWGAVLIMLVIAAATSLSSAASASAASSNTSGAAAPAPGLPLSLNVLGIGVNLTVPSVGGLLTSLLGSPTTSTGESTGGSKPPSSGHHVTNPSGRTGGSTSSHVTKPTVTHPSGAVAVTNVQQVQNTPTTAPAPKPKQSSHPASSKPNKSEAIVMVERLLPGSGIGLLLAIALVTAGGVAIFVRLGGRRGVHRT
jgi:hypothetical protein